MDLLTVRNTSTDRPLRLGHDLLGDRVIAPGEDAIVPAEYIDIWFGSPAAKDEGNVRDREFEFKRCRTLWGFYPGMMPETWWTDDHQESVEIGGGLTELRDVPHYRPDFEVYSLDGTRIITVLDDPTGTAAAAAGVIEQSASARDLATMQAEIDRLQRTINDVLAAQATVASTPDVLSPAAAAAAQIADAAEGSQADRNEARDLIPQAPADSDTVAADTPRQPRTGQPRTRTTASSGAGSKGRG